MLYCATTFRNSHPSPCPFASYSFPISTGIPFGFGKKIRHRGAGTRLHTLEMQIPISNIPPEISSITPHPPTRPPSHPSTRLSMINRHRRNHRPTSSPDGPRQKRKRCRNVGARVLTPLWRFERTLPARVRTADHRHRRRRSRKVGREGGREGGSPSCSKPLRDRIESFPRSAGWIQREREREREKAFAACRRFRSALPRVTALPKDSSLTASQTRALPRLEAFHLGESVSRQGRMQKPHGPSAMIYGSVV